MEEGKEVGEVQNFTESIGEKKRKQRKDSNKDGANGTSVIS